MVASDFFQHAASIRSLKSVLAAIRTGCASTVSRLFSPVALMSATTALVFVIWWRWDFFPIVRMSWLFLGQGIFIGVLAVSIAALIFAISIGASGENDTPWYRLRSVKVASLLGAPEPVDAQRTRTTQWLVYFVCGEELLLRGYLLQGLLVVYEGSVWIPLLTSVFASFAIGAVLRQPFTLDPVPVRSISGYALHPIWKTFRSRIWLGAVLAAEATVLTMFVLQTRSLFGALVARCVIEVFRPQLLSWCHRSSEQVRSYVVFQWRRLFRSR